MENPLSSRPDPHTIQSLRITPPSAPSSAPQPPQPPRPRRLAGLRRFWWYRVRPRQGAFAVAGMMALVGAYMVYTAVVPLAWQHRVSETVGWLFGQIASLIGGINPYALEGGAVVLLALLIAILLIFPRRQRFAYLDARLPESSLSSEVAPISVYLDAENQVGKTDAPLFRDHLRAFLREHGQKADLFYYTDVERDSRMHTVYPELRRLGFRLVDVPHSPFRITSAFSNQRNVVDMELAIHAISRSLLGPAGQHIVLVCNDQDYIPLIYRLLAGGHSVEVWAAKLAQAFLLLSDYFPDRYSTYQWAPQTIGAPQPASTHSGSPEEENALLSAPHIPQTIHNTAAYAERNAPSRARHSRRRHANISRSLLVPSAPPRSQSPLAVVTSSTTFARHGEGEVAPNVEDALLLDAPPDTMALAWLVVGITQTLTILADTVKSKTPSQRELQNFRSNLGRLETLKNLRYTGTHSLEDWLTHLQATGALESAPTAPASQGNKLPYVVGAISPEEAARRFGRFLQRIAHVAYALTAAHPDRPIPLNELCLIVRRDPLPADLTAFGRLLEPQGTSGQFSTHSIHMRFLCQCAGALGLFMYDATILARHPFSLQLIASDTSQANASPPANVPGAETEAPPQEPAERDGK